MCMYGMTSLLKICFQNDKNKPINSFLICMRSCKASVESISALMNEIMATWYGIFSDNFSSFTTTLNLYLCCLARCKKLYRC